MVYTIKQDIVVPYHYVYNASQLQPGFHQNHLHSTGNPNSTVQNERDYLAGHYTSANYTHLVGITNGQVDIRQVMNTNGGAWDVGGDWNWETYAAIEFVEGSIKSQADFNKAYPAYIWLVRYLAKQAGIPYTIDNSNISGIKTHNYASATGHGSDHVDPIPFLSKWGVSRDKLNRDIINGIGEEDIVQKSSGETVFQKSGVWYTDRGFKNKANGMINHMGSYWVFDNGILKKSKFTSIWGKLYWSGSDGKVIQGTGELNGAKFDFGNDGTYNVKNITVINPDEFVKHFK